MKLIVIVVLALGVLVAASLCTPVPKSTESTREIICDNNGCILADKDYGPTVTPYTPTMKPRVRTLLVPPLWINTTWMEIVGKSTTTVPPEEDRSSTFSLEYEEDNMV